MALPLVGFLLRFGNVARAMAQTLSFINRVIPDLGAKAQQVRPPQIRITHNFPEVMRGLDRLHEDIRRQAIPRALNKLAELARTEARRQITATYNMKAGDVRERLKIKRAKLDASVAVLYVDTRGARGGRSMNVARFLVGGGGKGSRMTKAAARRGLKAGTRAPLKVKITKGSAKSVGPAFLANSGRTAFKRVGDKRFPIEPVQTIDVQQMFNQRRINESIRAFIERRWPEVIDREVSYFIRQWQRR